ncbi:MAG: hypothetical protein PHP57_01275 [Sideroxydans sp.]|nr:hypothetical protein [Sideroxydans sp.]
MSSDSETLIFSPQKGIWVLFLLAPLLALAFVLFMLQYEIKLIWWAPPLALTLFMVLALPFFKPYKIIFVPSNRIVEVHHRLRAKPTCYIFDELESIKSCDTFSGEGDTYIQLEVLLKNGNRIALLTTSPVWGTFLSGYTEPEELSNLRGKIATMAGIKDLGFKPTL